MSPELRACLTRIDALLDDGILTPAEAVEQRRKANDTEVRTIFFPLSPSLSLSVAGSAPGCSLCAGCSSRCAPPSLSRASSLRLSLSQSWSCFLSGSGFLSGSCFLSSSGWLS